MRPRSRTRSATWPWEHERSNVAAVQLEQAQALFPGARGYLDSATMGLPPASAMDELWPPSRSGAAARPRRLGTTPGWTARGRRSRGCVGVPEGHVAIGGQSVLVRGGRGRFAARGRRGALPRGRLRLRDLPVPGAARARRERPVGAARAAGRRAAAGDQRGGVQRSAVLGRAGRGPGRCRGRRGGLRRDHLPRRHPGLRLASARRGTLRLPRVQRLQVAALAARDLLPDRPCGAPGGAHAAARRLVRGRGALGHALRRPASPRRGRPPARPLARPGSRGWGRPRRSSCSPTIGAEAIRDHASRLANRVRDGLGMEPSDSAIVSLRVPARGERLERAGIRASLRADGARIGFHLYNDEQDAEAVLSRPCGLIGARGDSRS